MLDSLKEYLIDFFHVRLYPVIVIFVVLFSILVCEMFSLQIVNSSEIIESDSATTSREIDIKATRGNIYDCKGRLLAYNKLSYNVTFLRNNSFSKLDNDQKNTMIYHLIKLIEKKGATLSTEFYLEQDSKGNIVYNVDGNTRYRFIAEVFGTNLQKMTQEMKDMTAPELYDYLRNDDSTSSPQFCLDPSYDDATALKILAVRYAIFITRFKQYETLTLAKNVDEETVAAIKENTADLPGVDIQEDTIRVYKKSKYFAHMLGYTGAVSEEKLDKLKEEDPTTDYNTSDQIGISGLESTYENQLRGTKGKQILTIDEGTSRIVETSTEKKPVAGNNLYLTIDADLQEECYNILEAHLAGILIANINNSMSAGTRGSSTKDIKVPIYDVYNAIFDNNIVDIDRFSTKKASALEKSIYSRYKSRSRQLLAKMKGYLAADNQVTKKQMSDEMAEFMDAFYKLLKDEGVFNTSKVDTNDDIYVRYTKGNISLSKYLQHAISQGWIDDFSAMNVGDEYYSTQELYQKLIDYGMGLIRTKRDFQKLVYSYMVYHYEISGTECCRLLVEQKVIKKDQTEYDQLCSGALNPYAFIIRKIKKLELTPGMLGLDPCSGSMIVTDVNTGKVKAMVTYPSYDNNKMANQVDSEYFYKYLSDNNASPLINRPTQVELAPGSTFKLISSVAALEEGIISPGSTITDRVTFDRNVSIYGTPKCWSTYSHGSINVSQAIGVSCNYFFYTMGYELAGGDHNLNDSRGLARLKKYGDMFGLTDKSGVEITEATPHFSTEDCVRSAIGQGNHAYAPIQLARYVTTVANSGTCYNLTLVDQIKDVSGEVLVSNKAKVRNKVNISQSTWDAIHKGMYLVVNGGSSSIHQNFVGLSKTVAGKTGTAQQNTQHPNHAYFVSYAPYQNPSISVVCVIPNGYASANAASTASDVYKYYFSSAKKKKKAKKHEATSETRQQVTD